jgi:hypothetical protein
VGWSAQVALNPGGKVALFARLLVQGGLSLFARSAKIRGEAANLPNLIAIQRPKIDQKKPKTIPGPLLSPAYIDLNA